jgi:hypothetical protein
MPKRARTIFLVIEVLVCFGVLIPLLLLGTAALPMWIAILQTECFKFAAAKNPDAGLLLLAVAPIALVVAGNLGLAGIVRVLYLLSQHRPAAKRHLGTLTLLCAGIAGVAGFNLLEGPRDLLGQPVAFALYFGLPMLATGHLLFLGRRFLFRT